MSAAGLTPRRPAGQVKANGQPSSATADTEKSGSADQNTATQTNWILERCKAIVVVLSFLVAAICLHVQQFAGVPLYLFNRRLFHSWQTAVKESTALLLIGLNGWRAPTTVDITCDASVEGQIKKTSTGKVVFDAPDRMVLTANHQIYTDWIYLWWSAYTAKQHGSLIIVMKDALQKIPIIGPGMTFFSWVFLSRRWEADELRLRDSMRKLSEDRLPMWFLIFPEGTNLSARSRKLSKKWADKMGIADFDLTLIPRSRGLQFCLIELSKSVDWLYDSTIAYDGIPPETDSQDVWNLRNMYVEGRKAPKAHIHWRRFAMDCIPVHDTEAFDQWLYERWAEKDRLLKHHLQFGCFPSSATQIIAKVELWKAREAFKIFLSIFPVLILWWMLKLGWGAVSSLVGA